MNSAPLDDSYWVEEGKFLAGRNPLAVWNISHEQVIQTLLDAGINTFIDLTDKDEFQGKSYAPIIQKLDPIGNAEYFNFPIIDFGLPTSAQMEQILHQIHTTLAKGRKIYIHCYAGLGRTGTVVGCYLVARGSSGPAALAEITRLREQAGLYGIDSPQTREQKAFVRNWPNPPAARGGVK